MNNYLQPTGEDHFDKTALPKVLQVTEASLASGLFTLLSPSTSISKDFSLSFRDFLKQDSDWFVWFSLSSPVIARSFRSLSHSFSLLTRQVKNFGKAGRTKYTHLVDQDTTFNEAYSQKFYQHLAPLPPVEWKTKKGMGGVGEVGKRK